jgi:hypothetical protein
MKSRLVPLALATMAAGVLAACGGSDSAGTPIVPVAGLSLDHATLALAAGSPGTTATLTAVPIPANATELEVSWITSNPGVATLSATTGSAVTITAHAAGGATITARTRNGLFAATCAVTVTTAAVPVAGITLDHATLSLAMNGPGTSGTLTATVYPAGATNPNVTWTTSDAAVAALSAVTGSSVTVTGRSGGTAIITATTEDGHRTASCPVRVALLDVAIPAATASAHLVETGTGTGQYDTKVNGAYAEIAVDPLVFYAGASGFKDGDADGGVLFNFYASGTGAAVGVTQGMSAYVGIPAASIPTTSTSVKVVVTAKAPPASGSARLALLAHAGLASGRVLAVSDVLTSTRAEYVFDAVPPGVQLDLCDGGPDGQRMYLEAIRVEPSATPVPDTTPPAEVTGLTATSDVMHTSQVVLAWVGPLDADFAGVEISYPGLAAPIVVPANQASQAVTGLTAGLAYTFTVRTVDVAGNRSAGVTVNGTPGVVPALLDEALPASLAATVNAATSAAPGVVQTVPQSHLVYWSRSAGTYFKANDGKFMLNYRGIDATPVGTVPPNVYLYVGIPAAHTTTTTSPSVKVTVLATQYNVLAGLKLVLLDASNKVLAATTLPAGTVSGAVPAAYTFDGVAPNGELRIASDVAYLYVTGVKVEQSATAATVR